MPSTTLVVPLVFNQECDEETQRMFAQSLEDGLRSHPDSSIVHGDVSPDSTTCDEQACVAEQAADANAAFIVRTTIDLDARNYHFTLALIDGATGHVVARDEQTCEICGLDEAAQQLRDQAAMLANQIGTRLDAVTSVSIDAEPAGAIVELDGVAIGTTPLTHTVEAGRHTIIVRAPGHQPAQRSFVVTRGVEETLRFDLAQATTSPKQSVRPWTIASLAVGGVGLISGATLLALNGRPYRRNCNGDNLDPNGLCRFRYETLGLGATLTVAGVLATGAGVALLVRDRKRSHGPRVDVGVGPQSVTVRLTF